MGQKIFDDTKSFHIILILTLSILMLGNIVNKQIFLALGIISWSMVYMYNKKIHNIEFILLRMLILSIPLSFTNIFGQSYSESILSWFNIFLLTMIVIYIFKYVISGKVYLDHLSLLSILFIIIGILPVLWAKDIIDGFEQYINMILLFILVILGNSFKNNLNAVEKDMLKTDYVLATIITAIGLIIQILFIKKLNIEIGNYKFLGNYRHSYGFLFSDYSFLSLFLTSGAMMMYFSHNERLKSRIKWIIIIVCLLTSSVLTSARTGIVSFIIVFAMYSSLNVLNLIRKGSIKSIKVIIMNLTVIIASYSLIGRSRSTAKFSDSGRSVINFKAFKIFLENPILGIGFGNNDQLGTFPHNIFFQSLVQGGLLYTIPLIIFLLVLLWTAYKKDTNILAVLLCILFGALFIPNIFSSRFLPVIALLLSII